MQRFRKAADLTAADGNEQRIAQKFALVAAAGSLAVRCGILPLPDVEAAVLAVYQRRGRHPPRAETKAFVSAREAVQAYYRQHQQALRDLGSGSYPELTDAELNAHPGFIKRDGGATWLLIRSERWRKAFGSQASSMLQDLRAKGRLWARDGLHSQEKVRALKPKDRVYRIELDT